jgi:GMP synthase (glutamine-hydrolysing)
LGGVVKIAIIDNGSQYTHLIKRNYRDLGQETEIVNTAKKYEDVRDILENADAIVLSGGPNSVYAEKQETLSKKITTMVKNDEIAKPLLGICYGHQMIGYVFGAKVEKGAKAEYGISEIFIDNEDDILKELPKRFRAWVSHYDEVKEAPSGFSILAHSETCKIEAMKSNNKPVYGVQFHPEVWHTEKGDLILKNFLDIAKK